MADLLHVRDLEPFADIPAEKGWAMIADATALAVMVAPCLENPTPEQGAAAKAVLRRAILRWHETGVAGTVTQQSAGAFSQTTTVTPRGGLLWPSEINALQDICKAGSGTSGRAFTIHPAATYNDATHGEACSVAWGAPCSCGSVLNRLEGPLYPGYLP